MKALQIAEMQTKELLSLEVDQAEQTRSQIPDDDSTEDRDQSQHSPTQHRGENSGKQSYQRQRPVLFCHIHT